MKKSVAALLLFGILLVSCLALAQEDAQTYSGFNRLTDNVKMFFSSGDNKVRLALDIREKEVNSAIINSQNQDEKDAIKNLEGAHKKLQVVREKVSLDVAGEVKESVDEIVSKIEDKKDGLSDNFDVYALEEKKTKLIAELTEETFEYCKGLAEEDFALMLKEEECNPKTAPEPLKDDLEKLKDLQLRMFVKLMLEIRSCIDDPGTCNCEANVDPEQKAKCERMVALAVKCEYKDDENACSELEAMEPKAGDSFAESFVPDFLMNLFRDKSYMIGYNIKPSKGVPEECWDENDKPECRQYDHLKETSDDWDEYGNYIGKRPKNKEPTMQESVPQCFDEEGNFLEEECGKVTVIRNEEGLVNYIIENEIDNIIEEFENESREVDVNGSMEQTKVMEIKEGIKQIDGEIQGWVVDHPVGEGESDDGLTWEIKTEIAEGGEGTGGLTPEVKTELDAGGSSGDGGLTPEVKTDMAEGGGSEDKEVVEGSGGLAPGTTKEGPGDTVVEDDFVEGSPDNVIDEGTVDVVDDNIIDEGTVDVDEGADVVDDTTSSDSDSGSDDTGGVDEGPGEPGVVDEN